MALIVDAGALYAQADRSEPHHAAVARLLREDPGPLVTSALTAAEADFLILDRLGITVELAFLDDLADGTYRVECLSQGELKVARDLARKYRSLKLGLADCSLAVLAQRYQTRRILTFHERAFRRVVPLQGGVFTLLPADA